MAPKPINLINSCIYQIYSVDPKISDCYIGNTTSLVKRKCYHKKETNRGIKQNVLYRFIRQNGGWDNFRMAKVLDCPSTCKDQVLEAESYIINSGDYNCTLNKATMPTDPEPCVREVSA
jgi:hypothetical protein